MFPDSDFQSPKPPADTQDPHTLQQEFPTATPEITPQTPDPNGIPVPFYRRPLPPAITIILGGLAGLLLLGIVATPTSGARHSTRLQWQQRHTPSQNLQSLPENPQPVLSQE